MLSQIGLQRQVFVFMSAVDMRKSFDSLYGLMKTFHSNPLSGDLFLFVSKDRKKAKVLFWTGNGLMIWMKRLEQGRFADVLARGRMSVSELTLFFD
jgi:transposase